MKGDIKFRNHSIPHRELKGQSSEKDRFSFKGLVIWLFFDCFLHIFFFSGVYTVITVISPISLGSAITLLLGVVFFGFIEIASFLWLTMKWDVFEINDLFSFQNKEMGNG